MTSALYRSVGRGAAPLMAAYVSNHYLSFRSGTADCEAPPVINKAGMKADADGDYYSMFPRRQLWQPRYPYPLWDRDWDGREPPVSVDKEADRQHARLLRKSGVTRHIILIRHGQYDENSKV
jgi:hypothetical protein